jgi:hypothetical protein
MINAEIIDKSIVEVVEADEVLRGLIPYSEFTVQVVNEPWTLEDEPWRVTWVGKHNGDLCSVVLIQMPLDGKDFTLITTYTDADKVINYVFRKDQYHSKEEMK